ncbi:hypothetical protein [Mucilaginibacter gracilis]|uniref:hypothetical protein n=1 Tax=Mucilaginibacter gracilis TaxID=423350 RepID=UPI000EB31A69|nr:hypothetical protein [Mucilaginibacter gracilis]
MNKINIYLSQTRFAIGCFANKHREYLSILVALLLLLITPTVLRGFDPSAAPLDPGVLSAIVMAVVAVMVFKSVTWWLIKSIWPVFADYSKNHFERNFKTLTPLQKCAIYLSFYSFLMACFFVALVALL